MSPAHYILILGVCVCGGVCVLARQQAIQKPPIALAEPPPTFNLDEELKFIVGAAAARAQVSSPLVP